MRAAGRTLSPALLGHLPATVRVPGYDRASLRAGMAHIGVGAFHRCHQAEYTDDLLERRFDRWGVVGINIRNPLLGDTLGRQGGLYTRLTRQDERAEARVVGSIVSVVDSQQSPAPALQVLGSSEIDVVTLTVTEKGYCHRPASGELDLAHPDILHDIANPETPKSLPGILLRALEKRMDTHGRPVTIVSCDNIPSNGVILDNVVRALAERRGGRLPGWIAANAAFPSTMVDRITPATSAWDIETVARDFGYRDNAVVVGEPFHQWVIEGHFVGRAPQWELAGAVIVDDVEPFEHMKMRVLNAAQSTFAYLGLLAGHEHTSDDAADPLLAAFVRRMLMEESVPTLRPVPGIPAAGYVEQSLGRLRNTAIRHRNHQIATDGSQKIVQRLLNPIRERQQRGEATALLCVPVAGWMAYLIRASDRFGRLWNADDPYAAQVAAIAERVGDDAASLVSGILAIDGIFDPELAANGRFRTALTEGLAGLLGREPLAYVRRICEQGASSELKRSG